jgi:hypothetical protein
MKVQRLAGEYFIYNNPAKPRAFSAGLGRTRWVEAVKPPTEFGHERPASQGTTGPPRIQKCAGDLGKPVYGFPSVLGLMT